MAHGYDTIDWGRLARRWGGSYIAGEDHDPHRLELPHGAITIFVDMPSYGSNYVASFRTFRVFRVRAPFASTDGLEMHIRPKSWLTKFLSDLTTGDEAFDAAFRVTSSHPDKATQLLSSTSSYRDRTLDGAALRRHLLANRSLQLRVAEPELWSDDRRFVEGARQVSFERQEEMPSSDDELVAVVMLVRLMLDQLLAIGSARDVDPIRS